jgi:hypothetical protein
MRRAIALGLLCLAGATTATGADLTPFKASYAFRYHGMSAGGGELRLQQLPEGRWSYESVIRARALLLVRINRRSTSLFRIVDDKVVPDQFTSDENDQQIRFDWASGRVTGTVGRRNFDLPTQPGLLDPQSVQVALMQELLSGRMPSRFVLVDEDRIKDYRYAVEGSEVMESALGQHRVDIFSSRRPNSSKATYFWCAPDLGYIPLKVERRNGREVEWSMTLTSLER